MPLNVPADAVARWRSAGQRLHESKKRCGIVGKKRIGDARSSAGSVAQGVGSAGSRNRDGRSRGDSSVESAERAGNDQRGLRTSSLSRCGGNERHAGRQCVGYGCAGGVGYAKILHRDGINQRAGNEDRIGGCRKSQKQVGIPGDTHQHGGGGSVVGRVGIIGAVGGDAGDVLNDGFGRRARSDFQSDGKRGGAGIGQAGDGAIDRRGSADSRSSTRPAGWYGADGLESRVGRNIFVKDDGLRKVGAVVGDDYGVHNVRACRNDRSGDSLRNCQIRGSEHGHVAAGGGVIRGVAVTGGRGDICRSRKLWSRR